MWVRCVLAVIAAFFPQLVFADGLNENCVVSILNRTVKVKADGTWVLPNIPIVPVAIRARAICTENGRTREGESALFELANGASITLPPIELVPLAPIPTRLDLQPSSRTLTKVGESAQLTAMATYADGVLADVSSTGTFFTSSNPLIASISSTGVVTAASSGFVIFQAVNEGTQGTTSLLVNIADVDSDGDGIADSIELDRGLNPNDPVDGMLDADSDGLTLAEELAAGTNPDKADTDGDGLSDGDELRCRPRSCSNPVVEDSDNDGLGDGLEIRTGSNPLDGRSFNLAAAVAELQVTPATTTLWKSTGVKLKVMGRLIDGKVLDLSSSFYQTTYASSAPSVCRIFTGDGLIQAMGVGECDISVNVNGHMANAKVLVKDGTVPLLVSELTYYQINGIAIAGNFALVAAAESGLKVFDLSADRTKLKLLGSQLVDGTALDIAHDGNGKVFVATSAGIAAVDVSNPAVPKKVGTLSGLRDARGIKLRQGLAFVAAMGGFYIIDVSNPATMKIMGQLAFGSGEQLVIDSKRNLAIVALAEGGVKIIDISDVNNPLLVSEVAGDLHVKGIALYGEFVCAASESLGLFAIDLRDPLRPSVLAQNELKGKHQLYSLAIAGSFAIAGGRERDDLFTTTTIFDISDPFNPREHAKLGWGLAQNNRNLAVQSGDGFIYFALSQPYAERGPSAGWGYFAVGAFKPGTDFGGVAPQVSMEVSRTGEWAYIGEQLTVSAKASDDVGVASVDFLVNDVLQFRSTSAPHTYSFAVQPDPNILRLQVRANDFGGAVGVTDEKALTVIADPMTTVVGTVSDSGGNPLGGAAVSATGGRSGVTDPTGRFSIADVPVSLGPVSVQAKLVLPTGAQRITSKTAAAVAGGVTDLGSLTVVEAAIERSFGRRICQDTLCSVTAQMPFAFPLGAQRYRDVLVRRGYLSFDGNPIGTSLFSLGDDYRNHPLAIGLLRPDFSAVYANAELPNKFAVTYVGPGDGILQIQLFADGRVAYLYEGIGTRYTEGLVGLIPPATTANPEMAVQFRTLSEFEVPAGSAIVEHLNYANRFMMHEGAVVFTPTAAGGYTVRTISTPAAAAVGAVAGAPKTSAAAHQGLRKTGKGKVPDLANAEVHVYSSGNPRYVGMTNTDSSGKFQLTGVPPGTCRVEIRRNGELLALGRGVVAAATDKLSHITFAPVEQPAREGSNAQ